MPAVVALLIRSTIQMAVTLGLVQLAESYLLPLVNKAIAAVIELFGVSDTEAQDIVANEYLQFAEQVGIGVVALRTKLPTKIAERLGFTSKGWSKRTLSPKAAAAVTAAPRVAAIVTEAAAIPTAADAPAILSQAKTIMQGFGVAYNFIYKQLGLVFLAFIAMNNLVDFGNWNSGAYQKTFQAIFAKVTGGLLVPDADYRQSRTLSPDVFDKVYQTYKIEGAVGINDTYKQQSVLFSRNAFLDVADRIGADLLRTTQKAATKDVLLATQLMIIFREEAPVAAAPTVAAPPRVAEARITPPVTINVGGIQFGQIQIPPVVVDKITNIDDLKAVISSSITDFINQIDDRLSFELRQVKMFIAPGGRIITPNPPVFTEKVPRSSTGATRTVTNKIVVLDVYFTTHELKRTKIFSLPLDYSIADNIITPFSATEQIAIPVVTETTRTIFPSPTSTPTAPPTSQATPVVPSVPPPAAPVTVTPPTPPIQTPAPVQPAPVVQSSGPVADYLDTLGYVSTPEAIANLKKNFGETTDAGLLYTMQSFYRSNGYVYSAVKLTATPTPTPPVTPAATSVFPRTVTVGSSSAYVRSGAARTYPLAGSQSLAPGTSFVVVGFINGELVENESRWWKSQQGNFVWVGGTIEKP